MSEPYRVITEEQYRDYLSLKKKLDIATKALNKYAEIETYDWIDSQVVAKKSIKEIEEVK